MIKSLPAFISQLQVLCYLFMNNQFSRSPSFFTLRSQYSSTSIICPKMSTFSVYFTADITHTYLETQIQLDSQLHLTHCTVTTLSIFITQYKQIKPLKESNFYLAMRPSLVLMRIRQTGNSVGEFHLKNLVTKHQS